MQGRRRGAGRRRLHQAGAGSGRRSPCGAAPAASGGLAMTGGGCHHGVLALLVGLWLMLAGRGMRRRRGLGGGKTVSLDRVTLTSHRLGLTGRPDRLIKGDGSIIVEEWKSARTLRPWHRAQMGGYFLLIEEELRVRAPNPEVTPLPRPMSFVR